MNGRGDHEREPLGPDGVPFPSESEWLELPLPSADELPRAPDFVERTLHALAMDAAGEHAHRPLLPPDRLQTFAPPEPSTSFVDDTLQALRRDRSARWQELLDRHAAPEPSPAFVARTLAALTADREAERLLADADSDRVSRLHRWRFSAWPLLAVAAAAMFWLLLREAPRAPIELRFAQREPAAFADAYATSPLAAVLAIANRADDPYALAQGGPDGTWLRLEVGR